MNNEILKIDFEEGICTIMVNRPKALNALNKSVFDGLEAFFSNGYKEYKSLVGVIITGEGEKAFVAGADIKEFSDLTQKSAVALSKRGQDIFFLIENFHVPVVAAVNGYALGGGCELALACHMRAASDNAKFGFPEVKLGLIPGYGGTQRLGHLIGKSNALRMILSAKTISASKAMDYGMINKLTNEVALLEVAKDLINESSAMGPKAVAQAIRAVNAAFDSNQNGYKYEHEVFGRLMKGDECKEGVTAFIEKRKATFHRD